MTPRSLLPFVLLLTGACGAAAQQNAGAATATEPAHGTAQPDTNLTDVIAVIPVKDHAVATGWYRSWIGRGPDVVPMDGVAEWKLAGGAWIQVALDPDHAGGTSVVIGVEDIEAQLEVCADAGVAVGELQDHGFIQLVEAIDPDGNKVVFVQD